MHLSPCLQQVTSQSNIIWSCFDHYNALECINIYFLTPVLITQLHNNTRVPLCVSIPLPCDHNTVTNALACLNSGACYQSLSFIVYVYSPQHCMHLSFLSSPEGGWSSLLRLPSSLILHSNARRQHCR